MSEKMTLAIDINSNMVHAINGRLSDMDVSAVRGITNKRTDGRMTAMTTTMVVVPVTHANKNCVLRV